MVCMIIPRSSPLVCWKIFLTQFIAVKFFMLCSISPAKFVLIEIYLIPYGSIEFGTVCYDFIPELKNGPYQSAVKF